MSSIVYRTDKATGARYAYRSESYRDPETGKPRNRREYLGRVDPETGEILPKKAKARRTGQEPQVSAEAATAGACETDARIVELEAEIASLRNERDALAKAIERMCVAMRSAASDAEASLTSTDT